ncbi:hypothetical protein A1O3_06585 [Capronia epimyces CBS 606.96]|uniref:Cyclohexanone monooxygenase n=1 Tax=Capronia epimyces CBS 606.96 TaxID=1182542 RepID=W9XZF2_9EURO|nr:uncharacterized protein A1O3_06585 [Capronia epimyces CBS 606.96]EXJ82770.1 hypothetical protein A1O3_06585 [Capronia epimyces CBS 606.96]
MALTSAVPEVIPTSISGLGPGETVVTAPIHASEAPKNTPKAPLRTIFPPLVLEDHPIDETPSLKVAVVGAGISGITAGILLPEKVPGIDLVIYERHDDLGGTWHTNIYPGVRCDVQSDVYQSSFAPSNQWKANFARGADIKAYWKSVAKKYDVEKYVRFRSTVEGAEWSEEKARWLITLTTDGVRRVEEADFLVTATGVFSQPRLPDYPGIAEYQGHLRHSSNWDPNFDPTGKSIAVIGNGASGIQVLPQLQKVAKQLDHYARSPTWITSALGAKDAPPPDLDARDAVPSDAEGYLAYRKRIEYRYFSRLGTIFKGSEKNAAEQKRWEEGMAARLGDRADILAQVKPDFPAYCRRPTPGPGYLEALRQPNVKVITTPIERFTRTGIQTVDGQQRDVDAVICSTGADIAFTTSFPIVKDGFDLQAAWRPTGAIGFPDSYLGLAAPGFPNLLFVLGPNSGGVSGSLPYAVETQLTYIAKVLRKAASDGIRTISPSQAATNDYRAVVESFFPRTVLSENCSSWYNGGVPGGRILAVWPGSAAHNARVLRNVRWEDFEYTYRSQSGNRFAFFGNGWTKNDVRANEVDDPDAVDFSAHLKKEALDGQVDLKGYLESWYEF